MANKQRSYTTFMDHVSKDGQHIVFLEGFCRNQKDTDVVVKTRSITKGDGSPSTVASLNLSVVWPDKRVERMLGEDSVNKEWQSYFIQVDLFGYAAERIEKYGPVKNQILGFHGVLTIQEYDRRDGTKGKAVHLAADDFCVRTKKGGQNGAEESNAQAPGRPAGNTAPSYGDGFMHMPDNMDDMPFN